MLTSLVKAVLSVPSQYKLHCCYNTIYPLRFIHTIFHLPLPSLPYSESLIANRSQVVNSVAATELITTCFYKETPTASYLRRNPVLLSGPKEIRITVWKKTTTLS